MIRYTDDHGLRQYRPSLQEPRQMSWLQRLLDWWHVWKSR